MPQLDPPQKPPEIPVEGRITSPTPSSRTDVGGAGADLSLSRSGSFSRLNASAQEFVPRDGGHPRIVKIHHHPPAIHAFRPPSSHPTGVPQSAPPGRSIGVHEYYGGAIEGKGGFGEQESVQALADPNAASTSRDDLSEEIVLKITKQVEYYFSDANLATTEHLMRFISKDPDGFVPISVVASFKKIKALVQNNLLLANALRTSSKLIISDDKKKVRRVHPFTESDVEELQSRIVVAENLPEDHSYQNLMKIFSAAGSVKTIRTCYPQTPNGTITPINRSSKLDMLFYNKLHAFVEYETVEDAEKAVSEFNNERNWRSGPRLRLLNKCTGKHCSSRGKKAGSEVDGAVEEDSSSHLNDKQLEDVESHQVESSLEVLAEEAANDRDGGVRRGRARGRGRGCHGRGQYHHQNYNSHHQTLGGGSGHSNAIGTPPSAHPNHIYPPASAHKQPPGPRMPDGTRGFTMGRGKPISDPCPP